MEIGASAQIFAFAVFAFIAMAGALGMTTTMSMFRSAIFLMGSFIGVGGLFVLMMADLLGLLQVMMYIGGMLVMALFMVLFSGDPGGSMMASMMDLPLAERFFSLGLAHGMDHGDENGGHNHGEHRGGRGEGSGEHGGRHAEHGSGHGEHGSGHAEHDSGHGEHDSGDGGEHDSGGGEHDSGSGGERDDGGGHRHGGETGQNGDDGHTMEPMFIVDQKKAAAVMAVVVWLALSALILFRPAWPVVEAIPPQNSAEQIGDLLMSKYMIAFEGAGLLILLGIFGAVYLSRPGRYPDPTEREKIQAAVAETPAPIEEDPIEPLQTGAGRADSTNHSRSNA